MPNQHTRHRHQPSATKAVTWRQQSRPWRVFPLAVLAVVGMTAASGAATHMFREASHDRYADDILRTNFNQLVGERVFDRR